MTKTFTDSKVEEFEKKFADMPTSAIWYMPVKSFLRSALRDHAAYLKEEIAKVGNDITKSKHQALSDIIALLNKEIKE